MIIAELMSRSQFCKIISLLHKTRLFSHLMSPFLSLSSHTHTPYHHLSLTSKITSNYLFCCCCLKMIAATMLSHKRYISKQTRIMQIFSMFALFLLVKGIILPPLDFPQHPFAVCWENKIYIHSLVSRSLEMISLSILLPDGVGRSLIISAISSCWYGDNRIVSTRWTASRWKRKLFLIDNRRRSSMKVWLPTLGTRLKKIIWFSAKRVLFKARGLRVFIWKYF